MKTRWLGYKRWRARRRVTDDQFRAFLAAPLPPATTVFSRAELVVLDIETTSLDPADAAMLSVGWVIVSDGMVDLSTAESLVVRPPDEVGDSATVHGLTDSMVRGGMEPLIALSRVIEVLRGRILVVHHAGLDKGVLDRECRRYFGARLLVPIIDTLALEHRRQSRRDFLEENQSLRLSAMRERYGLPRYSGHNCLTDAIATAELLIAMVATHGDSSTTRLRDLY